jgi:inner membrane protein involved in colicin E2 resistance
MKAAILAGIALLLLVPLSLLGSLVAERTSQRDAAVQSVARGWGDRQWIAGPILAIPVTTESVPATPRFVSRFITLYRAQIHRSSVMPAAFSANRPAHAGSA